MRRWNGNGYKQKTPAPFEGRRISVWEPQGNLRLLFISERFRIPVIAEVIYGAAYHTEYRKTPILIDYGAYRSPDRA